MTVSLLPDRLCLLRFPREDLEICSHAILKHILFRDYSHSHREHRKDPLFSYIDNSLEISIFGDADDISRDFVKELCPRIEISDHIYRALQVDNVSIFYMSTYQTDLLFVQENRLPVVFTTLSKHGLHMALDEEVGTTPPHTPIPDQLHFWKRGMHDIEEEEHHDEQSGDEKAQYSAATDSRHVTMHSEFSLATPPGSRNSTSDHEDVENTVQVDTIDGLARQLMPLDIVSAQQHGRGAPTWTSAESADIDAEYGVRLELLKASPTTTTAFELRQQAVRTLPQNSLRCVGLNTDLEAGHQPWILKVIKILFYHDEIKKEAIRAGRGPTHDAPRFFSFTATSECVSMITDTYILEEFEEHELFMDMETHPLRLIQLDLHRFGLDKYGIIHSVARLLTEAGIDLLYLSTFSTANILVVEHRLSDAEKILSGSDASTSQESEFEEGCEGDDEDDESS
ncbi:hypothetical protein BC939DRAFT_324104 [Gamsiella multidivaricata]|uniref:uncharacterized protein n=1 Tax=Gamsiella multidivaricata TaxID=101098 RepID=UPI00221E3DEF|nr:uncharacterized protein BC939DRAFT_324104 [Gamsiella multidivaricata]KAI7829877.1 hypothetical protein BC939DRAFT_324104 [Gamsiella multidivaricata]